MLRDGPRVAAAATQDSKTFGDWVIGDWVIGDWVIGDWVIASGDLVIGRLELDSR